MLSLNGLVIHALVLPQIRRQSGRGLFEGVSEATKSLLLAAGAISVTSWYVPLFLGIARPLNFVVPAQAILLSYAVLLAVAVLASQLLGRLLPNKRAKSHASVVRFEPHSQRPRGQRMGDA